MKEALQKGGTVLLLPSSHSFPFCCPLFWSGTGLTQAFQNRSKMAKCFPHSSATPACIPRLWIKSSLLILETRNLLKASVSVYCTESSYLLQNQLKMIRKVIFWCYSPKACVNFQGGKNVLCAELHHTEFQQEVTLLLFFFFKFNKILFSSYVVAYWKIYTFLSCKRFYSFFHQVFCSLPQM